MAILRSGCCLFFSIGCLALGVLLGAVAVWLLIPYFQEKKCTPEDFRAEAVRITDKASQTTSDLAEQLRRKAPAIGKDNKENNKDSKEKR